MTSAAVAIRTKASWRSKGVAIEKKPSDAPFGPRAPVGSRAGKEWRFRQSSAYDLLVIGSFGGNAAEPRQVQAAGALAVPLSASAPPGGVQAGLNRLMLY